MTISLPKDLEVRLRDAATKAGIDAESLAARLIEQSLPNKVDQTTLDLLSQWDAEEKTADAAELESRKAQLREFMEQMNQNREQSEGANARRVYP